MGFLDDVRAEFERLKAAGLDRRVREVAGPQGPRVLLADEDGACREVLNVCSNDYLSLASHPAVVEAARAALENYGQGAGAARLISGSQSPHRALEDDLRAFLGTDVLLFSSGYHANLGAIPVLAGEGDLLISDSLNHASLIDGCRLSRAEVGVFPHGDVHAVERALSRAGGRTRRRMILTESLFSMDGDLARLQDLHHLAKRYEAVLYVDEAHAIGVLGPEGRGGCAAAGIPADDPDVVRMGTLGKAYGSYGAFVAAATPIVDLLRSRARGFVFTTGIPPSAAAAASAALRVSREEPERRTSLLKRSAALRAMLASQGWQVGEACAQIVPLPIGDPAETMEASGALLARGIFCQGIRPPTVPPGTSRLRLSLAAGHSDADLTLLARELEVLARARAARAAAQASGAKMRGSGETA